MSPPNKSFKKSCHGTWVVKQKLNPLHIHLFQLIASSLSGKHQLFASVISLRSTARKIMNCVDCTGGSSPETLLKYRGRVALTIGCIPIAYWCRKLKGQMHPTTKCSPLKTVQHAVWGTGHYVVPIWPYQKTAINFNKLGTRPHKKWTIIC